MYIYIDTNYKVTSNRKNKLNKEKIYEINQYMEICTKIYKYI